MPPETFFLRYRDVLKVATSTCLASRNISPKFPIKSYLYFSMIKTSTKGVQESENLKDDQKVEAKKHGVIQRDPTQLETIDGRLPCVNYHNKKINMIYRGRPGPRKGSLMENSAFFSLCLACLHGGT
ncbi:uncharacterized protein LOC143204329 [Rhynchophorus ferrugineus]|uniref:uncharacterized protein LOC143204329 n=1 Tax=Rhynchophorus ferrugineus TaxID=354439 RepID=UPI003FCD6142